jgi:hypothetical protein
MQSKVPPRSPRSAGPRGGKTHAAKPKASAEEKSRIALQNARRALPEIVKHFNQIRSEVFSFGVTEGTTEEPKRLYFGFGPGRTAEILDTPKDIMFKKHGPNAKETTITKHIDVNNLKRSIEKIAQLIKKL